LMVSSDIAVKLSKATVDAVAQDVVSVKAVMFTIGADANGNMKLYAHTTGDNIKSDRLKRYLFDTSITGVAPEDISVQLSREGNITDVVLSISRTVDGKSVTLQYMLGTQRGMILNFKGKMGTFRIVIENTKTEMNVVDSVVKAMADAPDTKTTVEAALKLGTYEEKTEVKVSRGEYDVITHEKAEDTEYAVHAATGGLDGKGEIKIRGNMRISIDGVGIFEFAQARELGKYDAKTKTTTNTFKNTCVYVGKEEVVEGDSYLLKAGVNETTADGVMNRFNSLNDMLTGADTAPNTRDALLNMAKDMTAGKTPKFEFTSVIIEKDAFSFAGGKAMIRVEGFTKNGEKVSLQEEMTEITYKNAVSRMNDLKAKIAGADSAEKLIGQREVGLDAAGEHLTASKGLLEDIAFKERRMFSFNVVDNKGAHISGRITPQTSSQEKVFTFMQNGKKVQTKEQWVSLFNGKDGAAVGHMYKGINADGETVREFAQLCDEKGLGNSALTSAMAEIYGREASVSLSKDGAKLEISMNLAKEGDFFRTELKDGRPALLRGEIKLELLFTGNFKLVTEVKLRDGFAGVKERSEIRLADGDKFNIVYGWVEIAKYNSVEAEREQNVFAPTSKGSGVSPRPTAPDSPDGNIKGEIDVAGGKCYLSGTWTVAEDKIVFAPGQTFTISGDTSFLAPFKVGGRTIDVGQTFAISKDVKGVHRAQALDEIKANVEKQ
ncbi:MAG: hypothetical protein PHP46_03895, partial [Candidatus Omnitrophica bacterium]|nr:hypothetical protein [Candidatus Omnitrophota bacterium]